MELTIPTPVGILHFMTESEIQLLTKHDVAAMRTAEDTPKTPNLSPEIIEKIEPLEADALPAIRLNQSSGASNDCEFRNSARFIANDITTFVSEDIIKLVIFSDTEVSDDQRCDEYDENISLVLLE